MEKDRMGDQTIRRWRSPVARDPRVATSAAFWPSSSDSFGQTAGARGEAGPGTRLFSLRFFPKDFSAKPPLEYELHAERQP